MAFWFWVVILSILALGLFEVYSRYKERNNPLPEEAAAEGEAAVEVQAELARAKMKIAMLESRLEESEAKLAEETTTRTDLEARYKEQLEKTEKAYQRQMVTLSERIATNSNGWGEKRNKPEEEYPVRMAAEVAAWRASLGGHPMVEPAVSEDVAALAGEIERNIEAQAPAIDVGSEETADPLIGPMAHMPDEWEHVPEPPDAAQATAADLVEEVVLTETPPEPEEEVLDQVVLLDEAAGEEAPAVEETDAADYEEPLETAVSVEEIPPLENRWPDLESLAMQRVMARQLGSEMDADYLDDEEFLREMGIEGESRTPESPADEAESWITDPLEEMAYHINDSEQPPAEEPPQDLLTGNDAGQQKQKITDHMWEDVIFSSAAEARPAVESRAAEVPGESDSFDLEDTEDAGNDEDAVVAATVASILSRAPGQAEGQNGAGVEDQEESGPGSSENESQAVAAPEDLVEADPPARQLLDTPLAGETAVIESAAEEDAAESIQEPPDAAEAAPESSPLAWQRQPVLWQAEYYDNTKLSDEPVIVRQDKDIDFEWLGNAPAKGVEPRTFSVRWSGILSLEPGQYRFTASAPDGLRLWLNERLVISAWYDQSEQTYQRDFAWPGGSMDIRVEHYENGGNAKASLTWDRIA